MTCSECGGPAFSDLILAEKKDACYQKVKASAKVWPSAYASGRLVQCRKKGAANYGNKSEGVAEGSYDYAKRGKELDAATKKIQANLDRRIRGKELDASVKKIQTALDKRIKKTDKGVAEGSGYDGSEPLDLSKNPSVNDVFKRALYIYDYEGYSNDMDYSEDDAIDQYVARKFGQDALNQLTTARNQSYFGRDDGRGMGKSRGSNLGQPSMPSGDFRITRAGKMHGQDAKDMKNKIANRLGRHPAPNLPEDYNPEYDDEAGMADNNLETLQRAVEGIDELIQSGDNLPEWCQEKIAVAKSMLVSVWDYMYSEEASDEVDPEIDAMFEAMQDLVLEMAHKNRVSEDLVWETFEAMPDNVLYETAAWRRKEGKSKKGGLNAKGVASYRRENPGSKLQMAVTTKPSKLKKGSKAAKRRKSFCARMSGVKGPMKKPNGKPTRKALALRKWNC
jgi:hypothetical protein